MKIGRVWIIDFRIWSIHRMVRIISFFVESDDFFHWILGLIDVRIFRTIAPFFDEIGYFFDEKPNDRVSSILSDDFLMNRTIKFRSYTCMGKIDFRFFGWFFRKRRRRVGAHASCCRQLYGDIYRKDALRDRRSASISFFFIDDGGECVCHHIKCRATLPLNPTAAFSGI